MKVYLRLTYLQKGSEKPSKVFLSVVGYDAEVAQTYSAEALAVLGMADTKFKKAAIDGRTDAICYYFTDGLSLYLDRKTNDFSEIEGNKVNGLIGAPLAPKTMLNDVVSFSVDPKIVNALFMSKVRHYFDRDFIDLSVDVSFVDDEKYLLTDGVDFVDGLTSDEIARLEDIIEVAAQKSNFDLIQIAKNWLEGPVDEIIIGMVIPYILSLIGKKLMIPGKLITAKPGKFTKPNPPKTPTPPSPKPKPDPLSPAKVSVPVRVNNVRAITHKEEELVKVGTGGH